MTISLTDSAAARINTLTQAGAHAGQLLRLAVDAGGCSGFEYRFSFVAQPDAEDEVFTHNGARLAVDPATLDLLRGASLDYTQDLMGAQFRVVNPNAVAGCGCGNSFAV